MKDLFSIIGRYNKYNCQYTLLKLSSYLLSYIYMVDIVNIAKIKDN